MTTLETRKKQLLARRSELTSRLGRIEEELDTPASADWDDHAIEMEDDEALEALGASGLKELRGIEAALGRIKAGTYGICTQCGNKIEKERLDVLPATPFCKDCAE